MLTPAPPEVVAQIVAEAERKFKMGSSPSSMQHTPRVSMTSKNIPSRERIGSVVECLTRD